MSDLSKHINIGKETEARLLQVGIMSYADLVSMGAECAFIRLRIIDSGACLSLLYGLEGSIEGVPWHKLPEYRKAMLKDFFNQLQRTQNPHLINRNHRWALRAAQIPIYSRQFYGKI